MIAAHFTPDKLAAFPHVDGVTAFFRKLLAVASGEPSLSEAQGLGDHEFVPWHIGATM